MTIDSYDFGNIQIEGNEYKTDVLVFENRIDLSWWRKEGHLLQMADLDDVLKDSPEIVVIGTGFYGMMKVTDDTKSSLKDKGIQLHVETTPVAVKLFNELHSSSNVVGAFHLTC